MPGFVVLPAASPPRLPRGNRTSDGVGSYVYAPASNRLTNRPQGPVSLDAAGHTTAQAGFSYTWDGPGRLKEVRLAGQLLATYHYDARHRRSRKVTTAAAPQGATTVLYAYDQDDHLLAETDATGPIRSYVWRDDTPVAQIEHRPSRRVLYLETDHLNTPRAARNETGALVWRWEADAFGSTLPDEDPDGDGTPTTVNLRYPGQIFDPESGLHYNQARYYDPTTGRYLSPDPIGLEGGLNTYAYVENNPLRYVDPLGLLPWTLLPKTGSCKASEWSICRAQCAPKAVKGCYVSISWRLRGIRGGEPIRSEERKVNCNCEDDCPDGDQKFGIPWWLPLVPIFTPWPDPY